VGKISLAKSKARNWSGLVRQLDALLAMNTDQMHTEIRRQIKQIVPEYEYLIEDSSAPFAMPEAIAEIMQVQTCAAGAD
jgi:hypothetical protein